MSGALRAIQHEMARLEKTTFDSTRGIRRELDELKVASDRSSNAMVGGMKKIGGAVIAAAAAYVSFRSAVALATSSIDASLSQQRITRGLEFAAGSAEAGAEAFKFVRQEAERLGLDLQSAASEYTRLAAAARGTTLEGKGTRDIFIAVSEAATVMGLSADQTGGALNAIQQMISKGTVAAEELRGQLGERLPGAFQMAARAMGVSTQELGKMLEQGQVLADDFLPKFAAELRKTFAADAVQASNQGQAGINKFKSAVYEAQVALGDALLPALLDVTREVSALIKEAKETGVLEENFRNIASAAMTVASAINAVAGATAGWLAKEAEQSKLSDIYDELRKKDPLALPVDLMAQAQKRLEFLKKMKEAERMPERGAGEVGDTSAAPAGPRAPSLTKQQNEKLLKLQLELEAARISSAQDGVQKRLAMEEAEYQFRLKEAGDFAQARAAIEQIHAQNVANIRMDAIVKAREKERAELLKEQKAAVALDEKRTREIYEARERLAIAQAGEDELKVLDIKHQAELIALEGNEAAITEIKRAHALERANFQQELDDKALQSAKTTNDAIVSNYLGMSRAIGQALGAFAGKSKAAFLAQQAFAVAEIAVNTARAYMAALAPPPLGLGPVLGLPLANSILGLGIAQGAAVAATTVAKFEKGGPVLGPSHARGGVPAEMEGGEFVFSRQDVSRMGGFGAMERMRQGPTNNWSPVINVHLSGSASPTDAEMVGDAVLQALARNIKEIEYRGIQA